MIFTYHHVINLQKLKVHAVQYVVCTLYFCKIARLYSNIYPTRCNITQFILSGNCSTCFEWYHHTSTGAQTTASTASGIYHTVTATCRWKLLYMFRVVPPPFFRSANNCIYNIWYLSHRYCYLPPSWKNWNGFECAVGGVRHSRHTQTRSNSSTIAADNNNGVKNTKYTIRNI